MLLNLFIRIFPRTPLRFTNSAGYSCKINHEAKMKFCAILKEFAEQTEGPNASSDDPSTFLRYKALKKLLKAAAEEQQQQTNRPEVAGSLSREEKPELKAPTTSEIKFLEIVQEDVKRINAYFMEREEEAIIKMQDLRDRREALQIATDDGTGDGGQRQQQQQRQKKQKNREADMHALHADLINFHGELILLFHYSTVNYAGILKILKKHDKLLSRERSGDSADRRRRDYLHTLLQQPFTSTESISRLVKAAEEEVRKVSVEMGGDVQQPSAYGGGTVDTADGGEKKRKEVPASTHPSAATAATAIGPTGEGNESREAEEAQILKRTRAALNMLERLQNSAHTPSTLLPVAPALPTIAATTTAATAATATAAATTSEGGKRAKVN